DPDVLGRAARAGVRGRAPLPDLVEEPGVLAREHPNRAVRRDTRRVAGRVDVAGPLDRTNRAAAGPVPATGTAAPAHRAAARSQPAAGARAAALAHAPGAALVAAASGRAAHPADGPAALEHDGAHRGRAGGLRGPGHLLARDAV